jgi:hypothetical protein
MLFQTYYRIDPWLFDPVIDRVENVSLVEPSIRFRFHLIQHWVRGEDTEDQRELLAVAFQ